MKHFVQCIVFLVVFACTACDSDNNFFYHPVSFRGEVTEEQLVLTGILHADEKPRLYVNSSRFFQDTVPLDSMFHEGGWNGYYLYYHNPRFLPDAQVEMSVDDGDWQTMYADTFSIAQYGGATGYYFTADKLLRAGEQVAFRVRHPRFQQVASVQQRIPAPAHATITLSEIDTTQATFSFGIDLPAYTGDSTQLLRISCTTYTKMLYENYYRDSTWIDTTYQTYPHIYSNDLRFAYYDKTNIKLSKNYYGATSSIGLYVPVSNVPTHYDMIGTLSPYNHSSHLYGKPATSPNDYPQPATQLDSIEIRVATVTIDEYLVWSTLLAGHFVYQYVPDYWSSDIDEMTDIVESIQEIFNEMGNMEGVQLYDNVEGGIGHVSALNADTYIFYPSSNQ